VHLLLTIMREMRAAIGDGTFEAYAEVFLKAYGGEGDSRTDAVRAVGE